MMILHNLKSCFSQLWQYWFDPLPSNSETTEMMLLADEDYESLFWELLTELELSSTVKEIPGQFSRYQDDPWFLMWLRRYSRNHKQSRPQTQKLFHGLQQIGAKNWGSLSAVARELSQLEKPATPPPTAAMPLKIESIAARIPASQHPGKAAMQESLAAVAPMNSKEVGSGVSSLLKQAAQQYQAGELSGAIALWGEAIASSSHCPIAYNGRGSALYYLGRYDDAIADFTKAIQQKPDFHLAYNNRGNVYADLNQLQAALADYTQALDAKPDFYLAYNGRAGVLARLGHALWAIADYTQALKINPRCHFAYNGRGRIRASLGQHQDAIADFSQALECNPHNPDAYHNRGNVYVELDQNEQAIADYTQAIAINPNLYQTYYCRGRIYAQQQQYDQALADYDEALNLNPHYVLAYNSRGIVYHHLGQYNSAIADFRRTLELKPNFWQAWINWGCPLIEGYNEVMALQTWQQGLNELSDTTPDYPEACARLYHYQGKAYSRQGKQQQNSHYYFNAIDCYHKAGRFIQDRPQWRSLYLEILHDLQTTYHLIGDTAQAQKWRSHVLDLLEKLLLETTNETQKRQLEAKFADLYSLRSQDWMHPDWHSMNIPAFDTPVLEESAVRR